MVKQRETREEKIAATQKHQQQFQYSLTSLPEKLPVHAITKAATPVQGYVKKDLQKTFFISLFLITGEITLYILITQHVLKLPWNLY